MVASLKTLVGAAAALAAVAVVKAQDDVILWHNRYHAVLAMAAYSPNYDQLCPVEEFTEAALRKNFPNSPYAPWEVLDRWGPTAHQGGGFTAMIPEMDKVVLVFAGDYWKLKNLPTETASLDVLGLANECPGCRANAFALQGYLEAKEATNGFALGMQRWRDTGLWWSQTGHGLGGMLSLIAALDLGGSRNVSKFIHAYGNPRTFNPAAAAYYNRVYGGDMTEQGYGNADPFGELIPASDEYAHINTAFYYYGWDDTYKMNHRVCYEAPEDPYCKPAAPYNELDHFFLFTNVGHCGGTARQNRTIAAQYLANLGVNVPASDIAAGSTSLPASTSSTSTLLNATASIAQLGDVSSNATLIADGATSTAASAASTLVSVPTLASSSSANTDVAPSSSSSTSAAAGVRNAANADQSNLAAATGTGGAGQLTVPLAAFAALSAAVAALL